MVTLKPTRFEAADLERTAENLLVVVGEVARELHAGNAALPGVRLDSSLADDFALDSLARIELGARIERTFNVTLSEAALFEADTPRDLLRAVLRTAGSAPLKASAVIADVRSGQAQAAPENVETLGELLAWHVGEHGDRPHIQFYDDYTDGEILTYRELWDGATAVAAGLQGRGLEPGQTVALMLPTSRDYFFAFYGVVLAGGVPVPIYPPVRRAQLEDHLRRQSRILVNCRASMLVATNDAIQVARLLTAAVDTLGHVVTVKQLADHRDTFEWVRRTADDTAFLQYTSGSTGDPKGVVLSHANLLANMRADGHAVGVNPNDVFVSWLPLYHDMGLIGAWFGSLYHAVHLVIMPPLSFLAKPQRWLWALHRYRGTLSAAPNFAFELCLKRVRDEDIEGIDLSHWRVAANGAEAISVHTLEAFCERFALFGFRRESMCPVYGLAECAVGLTFTPLGRGPLIDTVDRDVLARTGRAVPVAAAQSGTDVLRVVACGQPVPRHEIRVVDPAGRELPERVEGRLQFRGPSATSGYYQRPQATTQLFDDDWLETGDRAYIAAGDLYLTGRSKDIIIRAGRNIYPAELEDAIGDLDGIRKGHVAVFGSMDRASGTERVVVLAETRKKSDAAKTELRTAINARAADLMGTPPDEVVLAPPNAVLRTSSGKIRRTATRSLYERGRIGKPAGAVWVQVFRLVSAGILPQLRRAARAARAWAYAGWAWFAFGLLALPAWIITWLPLPRAAIWRCERNLARAAGMVTGTRVEFSGFEHLPPAGEPCVIVSNHQSYLDGIVLLALLPRPLNFLIKSELKRSPALGRPLARLGALFVERFDAAAGIGGMREAANSLEVGAALTVFVEGTFKRMPGLLPFHMGAFTVAAEGGVAVVPVAIRGTRSILRARSWFLRRGCIAVAVGAPIVPPSGGSTWSRSLTLRDAARAYILEHCGEPDLAHESNVVDDR